ERGRRTRRKGHETVGGGTEHSAATERWHPCPGPANAGASVRRSDSARGAAQAQMKGVHDHHP
ncbi:MAG: hypothetical protein ACRCYS_15295, partial [Beijerinckiaceae bacterium]